MKKKITNISTFNTKQYFKNFYVGRLDADYIFDLSNKQHHSMLTKFSVSTQDQVDPIQSGISDGYYKIILRERGELKLP